MNLYLVRHGQSVPNFEKRHSGWSQLPLTENGFADARRAGELLKDIPFDRIYSSDLTRAIQTARTALPGCEPIQLPLIRERSVGSLTEKLVTDCYAEHGDLYRDARAALDFTPFGGENVDMLTARAEKFLKMLEADPAENIVAFSHAGFIGVSLNLVLGVRLDHSRIRILNGSVLHFTHDEDGWHYLAGSAR